MDGLTGMAAAEAEIADLRLRCFAAESALRAQASVDNPSTLEYQRQRIVELEGIIRSFRPGYFDAIAAQKDDNVR